MTYGFRFLLFNIILLTGFSFFFYDFLEHLIPNKVEITKQELTLSNLKNRAMSAQESTKIANNEYIDASLVYKKLINNIHTLGLKSSVINSNRQGIRVAIDGLLINNLALLDYLQNSNIRTKVEKLFINQQQSKLQVIIYENKKI